MITIVHKSKKTAKPPSKKAGAAYNGKLWTEFVRSQELEETTLPCYYLGSRRKKVHGDTERSKIVQELFQDAVEVGAISLPTTYAANDFELITENIAGLPKKFDRVSIIFQSQSGPEICMAGFPCLKIQEGMIGSPDVHYVLSQIAKEIDAAYQ